MSSAVISLSQLNHFQTEKISENTIPFSILIPILVDFFLLPLILYLIRKTCKYFSTYHSSIQSQFCLFDTLEVQADKQDQVFWSSDRPCVADNINDESFCKEEVEMVMKKLGIFFHLEGEQKLQEKLSLNEITNMFVDKEPSLDEVKEAFDVFDENRDGFIDASELKRVLCSLGLKEGLEMEKCRMMIRVFDENGDDRIDFNEFVKVMENNFC